MTKSNKNNKDNKDSKNLKKDISPESDMENITDKEISEDSVKTSDTKEKEDTAKNHEDEDLNTKYVRLMADFQNFKRRSQEKEGQIYLRANEAIMTALLPVIDNFDRALEAEVNNEETIAHKEGLELIFTQFMDVLKKNGLEEMEALNVKFDPNFHNAVIMEDTNSTESGNVSCVLQKGYLLNGRVIRAAMVKVAN